jgi:hypothetical protein
MDFIVQTANAANALKETAGNDTEKQILILFFLMFN